MLGRRLAEMEPISRRTVVINVVTFLAVTGTVRLQFIIDSSLYK